MENFIISSVRNEVDLLHSNPVPDYFAVIPDKTPGHAYVKQSMQPNTKAYLVKYRRADALPKNEWQMHISDNVATLITNLQSNTEYLFSFASYVSDDKINWSPEVSYVVL